MTWEKSVLGGLRCLPGHCAVVCGWPWAGPGHLCSWPQPGDLRIPYFFSRGHSRTSGIPWQPALWRKAVKSKRTGFAETKIFAVHNVSEKIPEPPGELWSGCSFQKLASDWSCRKLPANWHGRCETRNFIAWQREIWRDSGINLRKREGKNQESN